MELFNKLQQTQENPDDDEVEAWEDWEAFPNIDQHSSFHEGEVVEFLAWLIHNFAPYVCIKPEYKDLREKYRYQVIEGQSFRDWMNADDFAFTYLTVQNNINKWHRLHKKLQELRRQSPPGAGGEVTDVPHKEARAIPGSEHKKGASIGSAEGLVRCRALTKFFNSNFCDTDKQHVNHNASALLLRLQEMARIEEEKTLQDAQQNGEKEQPRKKARKDTAASQVSVDPDYESINNSEWDRLSQELDIDVVTPLVTAI